MKKKLVFMLAASVFASTCLSGCGNSPSEEKKTDTAADSDQTAAEEQIGQDTGTDSGNVNLRFGAMKTNCRCFRNRLTRLSATTRARRILR